MKRGALAVTYVTTHSKQAACHRSPAHSRASYDASVRYVFLIRVDAFKSERSQGFRDIWRKAILIWIVTPVILLRAGVGIAILMCAGLGGGDRRIEIGRFRGFVGAAG
jgi:hypothetical protein